MERDLAGLRGEIDDIDSELLQLLARRMEVSAQIGEYKKRNNVTVVQMDRWKKILAEHVATGADLGLSPVLINKVFEAIHQAESAIPSIGVHLSHTAITESSIL